MKYPTNKYSNQTVSYNPNDFIALPGHPGYEYIDSDVDNLRFVKDSNGTVTIFEITTINSSNNYIVDILPYNSKNNSNKFRNTSLYEILNPDTSGDTEVVIVDTVGTKYLTDYAKYFLNITDNSDYLYPYWVYDDTLIYSSIHKIAAPIENNSVISYEVVDFSEYENYIDNINIGVAITERTKETDAPVITNSGKFIYYLYPDGSSALQEAVGLPLNTIDITGDFVITNSSWYYDRNFINRCDVIPEDLAEDLVLFKK